MPATTGTHSAFRGKVRHKRLNRSFGGSLFIFLVLALFGIFMLLPIVYSLSTSLKPLDELWYFPPKFLVENPTLKNFSDLFKVMSNSWIPFPRYIFNTVFISVVGTAGHVLLASMCAYGLSKFRFPGDRIMFNMVVYSLMFTATVTAIPSFLIIKQLGWIDSHLSLIIPAFAYPLGLYLMKQFMEQMVPDTILEAARIDGSGEFRMFFRIVMPMVKPAWLTLIIFSFQNLWNMGASVYIYDEKLKTFNYALSQILAGGVARTGTAAAATVIMMLVPITLFLITQSNIVETMSTSGMKE